MLSVLKRPPHDNFTFRLFYQLVKKIKVPFDGIYIWGSVLSPSYFNGLVSDQISTLEIKETELYFRDHLYDSVNEDVVVLAVKDHLTSANFNPWLETKPDVVGYLEDLFNFYQDKKFILITSLENLSSYIQLPNVKIVPWGGDLTNQSYQYKQLEPITDKNFNSSFNFISLNRNPRSHRTMLVSLLYGLDLESTGLISFIHKDNTDNIDTEWVFNADQSHIKDTIIRGFDTLKNAELNITDDVHIYGQLNDNTNVENFKNKLSAYYKNTFVEIVSETSYTESAFLLTEKTLNSIYGCNFPILICSPGSVQFLRDLGFDMFDDIIDHSYDSISNPIDRLYTALYNNKEILTNNELVKDIWKANKHRFLSNVNIAKTKMYDYYSVRAETEFTKCLNEFNI